MSAIKLFHADDDQPQIYISLEACDALDLLREIVYSFSVHAARMCQNVEQIEKDVYVTDTQQITGLEEWEEFFAAVEEAQENWADINRANRPYDFGWCKTHLYMLQACYDLDMALSDTRVHVGRIATNLLHTENDEIGNQFRSLKAQLAETGQTVRGAFNGQFPDLKKFEP